MSIDITVIISVMKRVNEAIKRLTATMNDPNADNETILDAKLETCMTMITAARELYAEYVNIAPNDERSLNAKLSVNAMLLELQQLSWSIPNESNDCDYITSLEYYNSLKNVAKRNAPGVKETFERLKVSMT